MLDSNQSLIPFIFPLKTPTIGNQLNSLARPSQLFGPGLQYSQALFIEFPVGTFLQDPEDHGTDARGCQTTLCGGKKPGTDALPLKFLKDINSVKLPYPAFGMTAFPAK